MIRFVVLLAALPLLSACVLINDLNYFPPESMGEQAQVRSAGTDERTRLLERALKNPLANAISNNKPEESSWDLFEGFLAFFASAASLAGTAIILMSKPAK